MRKYLFFILLLMTVTIFAESHSSKQKLKIIDHRIQSVQAVIEQDQNKRGQLQHELKNLEINTSNSEQVLLKTDKKLTSIQTQLSQSQQKEQEQQQKLRIEEASLAKQIRAAYILGRQPYLKFLLNQEDPERLDRTLTYYRYINKQRLQTINELQNIITNIEQYQNQIKNQYTELSVFKTKQTTEEKNLQHLKNNRKNVILTLNDQIQTKKQQLNQLLQNKKQLEKTIAAITHRFSNNEYSYQGNFPQLRGKLAWPTRGKLLNYYGTNIEQSELRWTGVLIKAPMGQPVYAVANGQVVFSKWLSGYGLLMIINHGNGFMTLYGRNQYLYKKEGETVHAGDLIAKVGDTGGYQSPALYFAIRQNAKPVNPSLWCH